MGSQQSSEQHNRRHNIIAGYDGRATEIQNMETNRDLSSYKGVKTDFGMSSDRGEDITQESTRIQQTVTDTTVNSTQKDFVEITFVWKEPGNDVFITGSFANWKQWFMLEKQENGIFYRKLQLPKEKHYFKFIVDKDWKYSTNYETISDEKGNINNVVDLTYININNSTVKKNTSNQANISKPTELKKKKLVKENNSYSEVYPERSGLNSDTPMIPSCYTNYFDLNNFSFQNKIGKPSFINLNYKELYCNSNNSTAEISQPPHINM